MSGNAPPVGVGIERMVDRFVVVPTHRAQVGVPNQWKSSRWVDFLASISRLGAVL